jgi:hypothetical protein
VRCYTVTANIFNHETGVTGVTGVTTGFFEGGDADQKSNDISAVTSVTPVTYQTHTKEECKDGELDPDDWSFNKEVEDLGIPDFLRRGQP